MRRVATPAGMTQFYGPADLAKAYNYDPTVDPHATIGIVDAYGYSTLEADLAAYRQMFGLPPCTTASGCLKIVDTSGQPSTLPDPPASDDWTIETALDVDMASAACPLCKILVVQADDDQGDGLEVANTTAAMLGATVISNSWGGPASSFTDLATDEGSGGNFNHPGVAIFVAAGDQGNTAADYPSTGEHVIAVGGTTLTADSSMRGYSEAAWSDGGSSCNTLTGFTQPTWQAAVVPSTACKGRAASDVAAEGDPNTGVVIYDNSGLSSQDGTDNGEIDGIGGTSLASPLVAGIFALTGHGNVDTAQIAYANTGAFNDVTTGTNKRTCTTAICKAGTGWDGPTGVGTPNGKLIAQIAGGTGTTMGSGSGSNGSGSNTGSNTGSDTGSDTGSNGDNNGGNGSSGGGCAVGGGSGLATILFGLGLAITRRRRAA